MTGDSRQRAPVRCDAVRHICAPPVSAKYLLQMNAEPLLIAIARVIAKRRLDVVMIGNAAAAIQGSPVTTMDFDFMFRKTSSNMAKLKRVADDLDAVVLRPYYPASQLYRMTRDRDGLQLDFMVKIDGIRSFESLRGRASLVAFGEHELRIASLADIIKSKERAGREQDLAVLPVLRRTLREKEAE